MSGNFKSRAKDMKDYLYWHDRSIKELIEYFDSLIEARAIDDMQGMLWRSSTTHQGTRVRTIGNT